MKEFLKKPGAMINATTSTIDDLLSHLRVYFQKNSFSRKDTDEEPPLRSELFTKHQMAQHAESLALSHQLDYGVMPEQLLKRLSENEEVLTRVINLLQDAVKEKDRISPAGEWLLDNYYLIEEQILTGKRYLPKGYSKGLPRLINTSSAGLPRVYDIALEIISHSDGHVDIASLSSFIASYQKINYLTIGELWAIPIMLRLALLENLRRVAARVAIDRIDENLANNWANKMILTAEKDPKNLVLLIADMARSNPPMVSAFVAPFTQKLQWKGPELSLTLSWLEQHLAEKGTTINAMVQNENQRQAADQVSMSNSINSLRFLAKIDWRDFVETMSVVEQILREDIDGIYSHMDFHTRDSYRHAVEKIAKKSGLPENEIARIAITLAKDNANENASQRKTHVGYYLVEKGRKDTEKFVKIQLKGRQLIKEKLPENTRPLYIAISLLLTLLIAGGLFLKAYADGVHGNDMFFLVVLFLLCASHLSLAISNWLATLLAKPRQLPRMNFSYGIPNNCRTLVVVPTILSNPDQVRSLVKELEVRFIANRDSNLLFGLLTDFKDADSESLPEDDELLSIAKKEITELNRKYKREHDDTFFLFQRPRKWNEKDKVWMGWERKRGKLTELNYLLRENGKNRFCAVIGVEALYHSVKYVITLDTDTQLPRDAAWKLVGMMAHPLNHPLYSEKKKRVVAGYGIIQPRIAISLHGAIRSWYTRMHENDSGIDPYTRVTSDVYQDVFSEGSYIGKGIYDVDVFTKVLESRFPENRILSHDLLEGAYIRCAFASDVQLYEEYPSRYSIDMSRRHRWIRGDWQIASWFLPFVPGIKGIHKNPLSALSRWKIFDNLRRSLMPVALLLLLLLGWTVLHSPWFWTLCVSAILLLPSLIISAWGILRKPDDVLYRHHIQNSIQAVYRNIMYAAFTLICLPYETFVSIDAIIRTIWRMLISRRKMLEWNPSGFDQGQYKSLFSVYLTMWFAPVISAVAFIYLTFFSPVTLLVALPFLIVWSLSPAIVWWLSRPLSAIKTKLNARQEIFLRKLTRKTWAFFEDFVGSEDNWLPPDNFQQHPFPVIAHRTSPTNIGLSLLANLSAFDFGYITTSQFIERTANTLQSMKMLDRYNGHFYNWYDTKTLQTLHPRYISAVDSGNLAGHLLTLKQGLLEIQNEKVIDTKVFNGLHDTILLLTEKLKAAGHPSFQKFLDDFETDISLMEKSPEVIKTVLDNLSIRYKSALLSINLQEGTDAYYWVEALDTQIKNAQQEILVCYPWLALDIPEKFKDAALFSGNYSLHEYLQRKEEWEHEIKDKYTFENTSGENVWIKNFQEHLDATTFFVSNRIGCLQTLAKTCDGFADMEYDFLYDPSRHLLTIGYNVDDHRRDGGFYDLLASEARLASFVAIAQGKIPQDNWFALGRRLTNVSGATTLLSWSGSMFEYLMPNLVMPSYENTLLDQTTTNVIKTQIDYGRQQGVPWGISESCYNMVDASLNYQYRAFGVPGLGFKRGLGDDLVIAPYASAMALMIDPEAACENLERLSTEGGEGKYGFFESIDYTPSRLPRGKSKILIQTFMVHHHGMSLLALTHLLLGQPMQKRFEREPRFQATLLLLQEQIPKATGFYTSSADALEITTASPVSEMRVIKTSNTALPEVQLLSNGKYHVMVSNSGGGYSRWNEYAVTRWREDTTCDNWGTFCYLRDINSGQYWSTAHQPTLKEAKTYEAVFSQGRAEFRRLDNNIETHTEIIVSPEDDIEIRRVSITNRTSSKKEIEITSYSEVVLAPPAADASHTTYSNLFVQTEIIPSQQAIICTRRPRSNGEAQPWMFHMMRIKGGKINQVSYETDREKFIGRGNTIVDPQSMNMPGNLSGSQGSVLDPIVSIRYTITLNEDETVALDMVTGISLVKETTLGLIDKYHDRHFRDRAFELSWTHSQVTLRQINASEADAQIYGRLAGSVIYANPLLRANANIIKQNWRGQSALWSYSISGDLPVVLLFVSDTENMSLVKQLIQARIYWKLKGLIVDLVILNEDQSGYRQVLQDQIQSLVSASTGIHTSNMQGNIFVRHADQVSQEDRVLLQTVARFIISDTRGSLEEQMNKKSISRTMVPLFVPSQTESVTTQNESITSDLIFFNGYGGFTSDGKEYIITTNRQKTTPAPWINVIANENFGTVVSESGSSYTWFENAHEFRLTPWNNDPVSDCGGEAFYIRDEKTGSFWSPMPFPVRGKTNYISRHGFGYSVFEHVETGIASETIVYTDIDTSIKFVLIKINNRSGRTRKLSVTGYVQWVLGDLHAKSHMHIVTETAPDNNTIFAKNAYSPEFSNRVTFFDTDDANSFSADRTEFIGRNGTLQYPDAMRYSGLSGKYGAAYDPCAALQTIIDIDDGKQKEIVFRIGAGKDMNDAENIVSSFKGTNAAATALDKVFKHWQQTLTQIQIETPDKALNIIANGWLLYQVISCRLWGRSGFYQSGGAFGFRDQLQDVIAVLHADSSLVRKQILLAASRQFKEGDVQHWWHPPLGRGVRTKCSDDFLWLPFVVMRYCTTTGDYAILDEEISFLEGRPLNANEESYYDLPGESETKKSLYDHCKRAVQHGLRLGTHGLPLIGSGDWNDGMNLVGIEGKGESVWLAFFLYTILKEFKKIALLKDEGFAKECGEKADEIRKNIYANGWDGEWYLRAYFDDGNLLGSKQNEECRIDSITQSWSVISGASDVSRGKKALESVNEYLIQRNNKLIQLLTPPFNISPLDPGYIKGYVPGVRENGGQYTHAAIWTVMAFARAGEQALTWEMLQMINPVNHGSSTESIAKYKTEPYVMAADVYGVAPHEGRGGWTWYTGSAGWMYQLITESFLGLKREGNILTFQPCIPVEWTSFTVHYRYMDTVYHITIEINYDSKETSVYIDNEEQADRQICLHDDKREHAVLIKINQQNFYQPDN